MSQQDEAFLPDDYQEPETSKYLNKFEEGDNKIRVLPAKEGKKTLIMGWEYWKIFGDKRKPVRVTKDTVVNISDLEINPKTGELDTQKFFWAMAVWNYKAKIVQIMELKQKTIRDVINNLSKNPKWGSPIQYDLIITQAVSNGKTTYTVTPEPKEPISKEILDIYKATPLNLDAMYEDKDPFDPNQNEILPDGLEEVNPDEIPL